MFKRTILAVGLMSLALPCSSLAQTTRREPWLGTWVSGTAGATLMFEPWEDGFKFVELQPADNGRPAARIVCFARMDGKIYPKSGSWNTDGLSWRRIDEDTYEYTGTMKGRVVERVLASFSRDGLTRTSHTIFADGKPADRTRIWTRKLAPGKDPWYGTWRRNRSTLTMEPWEDGFLLTFTTLPSEPGGEVERGNAFGRFDGQRYAESGNPDSDYLTFKRLDARTIAVSNIKDDKETTTATISFPEDGKTRISKTTGTDVTGKPVSSTATWTRVQ